MTDDETEEELAGDEDVVDDGDGPTEETSEVTTRKKTNP